MDFSKLTPQEITEVLDEIYPGYNFNAPYEKVIDTFKIINPDGSYPTAVVDLYIAHILHAQNIEIPPNYDVYALPSKIFLELTKVYHLPLNDDDVTRKRAKRITRIVNDMKGLTYNLKPTKIDLIPMGLYNRNISENLPLIIENSEFENSLFVVDISEEDFITYAEYLNSGRQNPFICELMSTDLKNFMCMVSPKVAGIPVGLGGIGYQDIKLAVPYIESAIEYIKNLLATGQYISVVYLTEDDGRTLKTLSMHPSSEIKEFIVDSLETITRS